MILLTRIIAFITITCASASFATKTLEHVTAGGFGGNEKTGKYIYDDRNLPLHFSKLNIVRDPQNKICYLQNDTVIVRIINRSTGNPIVQFPCVAENTRDKMYWDDRLESVNHAYSPANDAMYSGMLINSMYIDWYNTPVIIMDNTWFAQQKPLILRLHDWGGANAYWDGETANFGDGDTNTFYPFVSLTIIAHEISHGFTQQHSHLQYFAQSGALNESFSDMASKAAEYYATGGNHDWSLASEIMKANHAYRYMDNPRRDCEEATDMKICSIDNIKDYSPDLNVHFTSGIFNKAFYLLATASNWDTHKAFNVMVQANIEYWTQTSTFIEAACGVIEATKDYGYDTETVASAFKKVGIDTSMC